VLAGFGGGRRDRLLAHAGLAVAGSVLLIVGTAVNSNQWLAPLVTVPVVFCVLFAGVASANAASGATAALLAYVLPAASPGTVSMVPDRLAGWWMASAIGTAAVLLLYARPPVDRLRSAATDLVGNLAQHLEEAVAGPPTEVGSDRVLGAKHRLLSAFTEVPYRPTGLTVADQAIAGLVEALQWCTSSVLQAVAGPSCAQAHPADRQRLVRSAALLRQTVELLSGGPAPGIEDAVGDLDAMLVPYDAERRARGRRMKTTCTELSTSVRSWRQLAVSPPMPSLRLPGRGPRTTPRRPTRWSAFRWGPTGPSNATRGSGLSAALWVGTPACAPSGSSTAPEEPSLWPPRLP